MHRNLCIRVRAVANSSLAIHWQRSSQCISMHWWQSSYMGIVMAASILGRIIQHRFCTIRISTINEINNTISIVWMKKAHQLNLQKDAQICDEHWSLTKPEAWKYADGGSVEHWGLMSLSLGLEICWQARVQMYRELLFCICICICTSMFTFYVCACICSFGPDSLMSLSLGHEICRQAPVQM